MHPRFELQADLETLAAWADVPSQSLSAPGRMSGNGHQRLYPVLRVSKKNDRMISWMREGLIPSYACDDHDAAKRMEAHAEDMTCDSCFRSAFRRRRCIVPAQVLHEVRHLSPGIVHPCSFALESGKIFGIAAVWETWINDEGHALESFAIVTVLVTASLRSLFERMPVILQDGKAQERWLSEETGSAAVDLLKPLSPCELRDWKMTPSAVKMSIGGHDILDSATGTS